MKIDWNKVEEGYSLMQVIEKENKQLKDQLQQKESIIKEYKKHIKNINEWLDYNTEIGNLYWYDATPFPELKLSNEKSEVS